MSDCIDRSKLGSFIIKDSMLDTPQKVSNALRLYGQCVITCVVPLEDGMYYHAFSDLFEEDFEIQCGYVNHYELAFDNLTGKWTATKTSKQIMVVK